MSDIINKQRSNVRFTGHGDPLGVEAADTIEALRAENARLLEDLARRFEGLPETTWTSKDVAYVIRNFTARTAMGETE